MQTNKSEPPKLGFSIREACAATSLSRTSIYAKISRKELRVVRVGGRTIIPADALYALIAGDAQASALPK